MTKFIQPGYNDRGEEVPDPTPVEVPVGFRHPPTLRETMQRLIREEVSRAAEQSGDESFDEADDFNVDEEEFSSPYELTTMQEDAQMEALNKGGPDEAVQKSDAGGSGRESGKLREDNSDTRGGAKAGSSNASSEESTGRSGRGTDAADKVAGKR